jgi:hypothetical protein
MELLRIKPSLYTFLHAISRQLARDSTLGLAILHLQNISLFFGLLLLFFF